MIKNMLKICFCFVSLNVCMIGTQNPNSHTTVKTIIVETTTEYVTIITDIPRSDVELAMNLDYGRYTTMVFNYFNSQYDKRIESERCYDDYTKCILTQAISVPVCSVNNPYWVPRGYAQFNSFCDVYYDNCLRKMRYWRILNYGKCNFTSGSYYDFDINPSRK